MIIIILPGRSSLVHCFCGSMYNIKRTHMELLTNPNTDYLLNAPLEPLHSESMLWLKELDFWSDEMIFFYKLLHNKDTAKAFPSGEVAAIEKELIRLNGEMLDALRNKVAGHEQELALVYKATSVSGGQRYRDAHRKLLEEMHLLQLEIRKFKKNIFSFVLV